MSDEVTSWSPRLGLIWAGNTFGKMSERLVDPSGRASTPPFPAACGQVLVRTKSLYWKPWSFCLVASFLDGIHPPPLMSYTITVNYFCQFPPHFPQCPTKVVRKIARTSSRLVVSNSNNCIFMIDSLVLCYQSALTSLTWLLATKAIF